MYNIKNLLKITILIIEQSERDYLVKMTTFSVDSLGYFTAILVNFK